LELHEQTRLARAIAANEFLITSGLGKEPEYKANNVQQLAVADRSGSVNFMVIIPSNSIDIVSID
jgi:hypothetical protein